MELWIPDRVKPEDALQGIYTWLRLTSKPPYASIIQDRIHSLYPSVNEPQRLYTCNLTDDGFTVEHKEGHAKHLCAICLDEDVTVCHPLECGHMFHIDCIDRWLHRQNTCPICRFKIR